MKYVKSAAGQLKWCVVMTNQWSRGQLTDLVIALTDRRFDRIAFWSDDEAALASKVLSYACHLMGNRASTLSKHRAPPYCYAKLLMDESHDRTTPTLLSMKKDWKALANLEMSDVDDGGLSVDLGIIVDAQMRLIFQCFEVG